MLRHLSIRDFALIGTVDLDIGPGMTVLLGETGAGKSIIIDALAAALGERMSSDMLRSGARKAVIEATFDSSSMPALVKAIQDKELGWDGTDVVFRRELTSSGTSRCFVNDTPVQATVARDLAEHIMDFHGQHDTHGLLSPARHLEVLDAAAGLSGDADAVRTAWSAVTAARTALQTIVDRSDSVDAERARLQFLLDEIAGIGPEPGEDEHIAAELRRAESSEQVVSHASAVNDALYADEGSAYDDITNAHQHLKALTGFAPDLERFLPELDAALVSIKETAKAVAAYADPEDFSPERLEELRQRQVLLQRLVRKYGTLDRAVEERQRLEQDVHTLEHMDEALAAAERLLEETRAAATTLAKKLSKKRAAFIVDFQKLVNDGLHEMGMPSAVFNVHHLIGELGSTGIDRIEFLLSGNVGESPKPLGRVASGGELSRVMLAVKRAVARQGTMATMVFDEIDTGISGRVARHVGDVMKGLAERHQIICITHLPQIASLADAFVSVRKTEHDGITEVRASVIDTDAALTEVARLLSGVDVTTAALDGARELMGRRTATRKR